MAIRLKNMDDNLLMRWLENYNNWTEDELKSIWPELNNILEKSAEVFKNTPDNNPYKKNLKDAMLPLEAKKIIINNQIQELEFKNKNSNVAQDFTENLPVLQTRLSDLEKNIDDLELVKKNIDDKKVIAQINEDIFNIKSKQAQIQELGLLQEMNSRPAYMPDLKILQEDIKAEENKINPVNTKSIWNNNQNTKNINPTTPEYDSKKDDDKLFDNFKNSFVPMTDNQSKDKNKSNVMAIANTDNNYTPVFTYESIPDNNENKQALDQIVTEEKNVIDDFKEQYNRDIDTLGSVSNKLLINVTNKTTSWDEEKRFQAVHNRGGVFYFDVTWGTSKSRSTEAFNKFLSRDANNNLKIDRNSVDLVNQLKKQYEEKKKLYLKTLSSWTQKINNIEQLYTDRAGMILSNKITPQNKNNIIDQLKATRSDFIIAGKIFGGIDNAVTTNLAKIDSYERQINNLFVTPVANLETIKVATKNRETKKPVINISEQEKNQRTQLIHSYRVQRQENWDKNKDAGNYQLARLAYEKASEILLQIEKIDPKNEYVTKEKKYLSEVMLDIDNQIRIGQDEKITVDIAPTLGEDKKNPNAKKDPRISENIDVESIIKTGDIYLQKYNTKFDFDSCKKSLDNYHKAKIKLENEQKLEPSNAKIQEDLKSVNQLIENIDAVRYIEQEIVVWHQRTKGHNVFSMARFLYHVYNENYNDSSEKAFYGRYFKNPKVKEWSLNHAINVIKQISSSNGLTLDVDHIDSFSGKTESNLRKWTFLKNIELKNKLAEELKSFPTTPEFKQFIKEKLGLNLPENITANK